ncbi:DUF3987 domain-containing protein [Rhodococcus opacus]|nr:DUF3987 domain-containing protein [Rhodococcus opacus]
MTPTTEHGFPPEPDEPPDYGNDCERSEIAKEGAYAQVRVGNFARNDRVRSADKGVGKLPLRTDDLFYGPLGDIVNVAAGYTEADRVAMLATLITGVSAFTGGGNQGEGPHIKIGPDRSPLLLWFLIFGSSGTGRKGTATSVANVFLKRADPVLASEIITSGMSSGEGTVNLLKDPDPDSGKPGGTHEKRLFIIEEEFASVIAKSNYQGSTLSATIRLLHSGGPIANLKTERARASWTHVSILAHMTRKEFVSCYSAKDMSGGTYNRFVPVYVDREKVMTRPPVMTEKLITEQADILRLAINRARNVGLIDFSDAGGQYWDTVVHPDIDVTEDDSPASEFTRRATTNCWRLAALYAALDGESLIDVRHLKAAHALVRYSLDTAAWVFAPGVSDPELEKLFRYIDEKGLTKLARTDITRAFGNRIKADRLDALCERLVESRKFRQVTVPTKGRPREEFHRC